MKIIENREDKWQNNIFRDLEYIKKHYRYPWKSGIKTPLFRAIGFALLSIVLVLLEITIAKTNNVFIQYFLPLSSLFLAILSISRYLKSLKFTCISTGLNKALNQQLICSFLQKQHLLIYEHPECADIIQILSRPVSISSEQREVLVFIAMQDHILVNSHFTENHWIIMLKNRHDKSMSKALQQYATAYKARQEAETRERRH